MSGAGGPGITDDPKPSSTSTTVPGAAGPADVEPVLMMCRSTHGGAGYAPGSYRDGDTVVCGACGHRIIAPRPTGARPVRVSGWRGWLLRRTRTEPTWPEWML
jgi:DNA-directed RNA polymerase subunit RPC12/RpoP